MERDSYIKLISGTSSGAVFGAVRFCLGILSAGYGVAMKIRNGLYDRGIIKSLRSEKPVICVGNITAGGTGKTPMVVWVCGVLREKSYKVGILTRGYKSSVEGMNDEPAILAERCEGSEVVVDADRAKGAEKAVSELGCDVLVMDDGFQHRRLSRDVDILMIDATCPFGYGKVLPAGLLRESLDGIRRAKAAVLSRCDLVSEDEILRIEEKIRQQNGGILICTSLHKAVEIRGTSEGGMEAGEIKGRKIFAFCGIGNPEAFFEGILKLGGEISGKRVFEDHYAYGGDDIEAIVGEARDAGAEMILTTEKDWTKVGGLVEKDIGVMMGYLSIEMSFISGEGELRRLIETAADCTI